MSKSFIEQVHYIRIPVKDLEQSVQWYREILGVQLKTITDDPFAHFTIGNVPAFSIGFESPELSKFHAHLIENGVKVDDIKEDNGHYYFHFFDLNGNKFQVHW